MKVVVLGILITAYLTFSHKCKSMLLYWQNQVVEISILFILAFSALFSYDNEAFVWLLIGSMGLHQVTQLYMEVTARMKSQKLQSTEHRRLINS